MKILYDTQDEKFVRYPRDDEEEVIGLDPRYLPYQVILESEPDYDPETHFLTSQDTPDHEEHTLTRGWTVNPLAEPDPGGPGVPVDMLALARAAMAAILDALPLADRMVSQPLRVQAEHALNLGQIDLAKYIVANAVIPAHLEDTRTAILSLFP